MCVITISPEGKKLNKKKIEEMWDSNPHGAGVAYPLSSKKLKVVKGIMELDDFLKIYYDIPEVPHVFHFRFASVGARIPELTHPFDVNDPFRTELIFVTDKVLFHNGTISNHKILLYSLLPQMDKEDLHKFLDLEDYSDSQVVTLLLKKTGDPRILELFRDRFVFMTPDKIEKYGKFQEKDGFYFSSYIVRYFYFDFRKNDF